MSSTALTLRTAVSIANQAYENMGMKYPWSFVAVPTQHSRELCLRLLRVDEDVEASCTVSYAKPVHGFSNACHAAISDLNLQLHRVIADKQRKIA